MYCWNVWNVEPCVLTSSFVLVRLNYIENLNEIQVSNLCIWVSFFYCLMFIFTIYDINFTGLDSNDGCNCISLVFIFHWNSWNFHANLANRNKKEVNNWLHLFRLVIYVWLPALNINNVLSFKVPSIFQFFLDPNMSGYQLRDSFPFLI